MGTNSFFLGVNDKEREGYWVRDSDNSPVSLDVWDFYGEPDGDTNENCAYMNRNVTLKRRRWSRWLSVQCSGDQVARTTVCEKIRKSFSILQEGEK